MALENMISDKSSTELSVDLLNKWDSVIPLLSADKIKGQRININLADKYKFDFNGLLNHLNIPEDFWYVHCRINNLDSSNCYNGDFLDIALIDAEYLNTIHDVFTNNSTM